MPSTAIDSSLFGNAFSSEPMRRVFSGENRIRKYLDIEGALATVQGSLGIIPPDAAAGNPLSQGPTEVGLTRFFSETRAPARIACRRADATSR
jgi:adenylosuccinate lyase